jgi:hypothetical protein
MTGLSEKIIYRKKCVFFIFSTTSSEIFLILRKIQLILSSMCIGLHINGLSFFSYINETWIFFSWVTKSAQISNLMKILPVGAELFPAARWADRRTSGLSFVMPLCPDTHDAAKSRCSQFCLRTLKYNNSNYTSEVWGSRAHSMKISVPWYATSRVLVERTKASLTSYLHLQFFLHIFWIEPISPKHQYLSTKLYVVIDSNLLGEEAV